MADSLDVEMNVDFDTALQGAENLGNTLDDALSTSTDGLESALAEIITGVPPLELETDTSAIETDITNALETANLELPVTADTETLQNDLDDLSSRVDPIDIPVEADTTQAQDSLDQLGQSGNDAANGINDVTNAQDLFATSTQAASGASALAVGNLSGLTNIAGRLHGNLGIVAASAAGFAGTIGVLTHNGLEAEATMQRFHAIVGDLAPRINSLNIAGLNTNLNDFAISLGTDDEALRDVVTDLVSYTKGAGFSQDATVEFEQNLVALAGRAVALKPSLGTVDQAAQKLIFGLAKGGPKVQAYNITLNQQDVIARALSNTHKESARELTILDKAFAGSQLAIEKHGAAVKGDVLTGTKNLVIEERSLKEELNNVIEAAGKPLARGFLEAFQDSLPSIQVFASALGDLAASALPVIIDLLVVAAPVLRGFADVIGGIPTPLLAIAAGLLIFSKGLSPLTKAFQGLSGFAKTMGAQLTLTGTQAVVAGAEVEAGGAAATTGGAGFELAGTEAATSAPGFELAGSSAFLAGEEVATAGAVAEVGAAEFQVAALSMSTAMGALAAFTIGFTVSKMVFELTGLDDVIQDTTRWIFDLGDSMADVPEKVDDYNKAISEAADLTGNELVVAFRNAAAADKAAMDEIGIHTDPVTNKIRAFTDIAGKSLKAGYELALRSKERSTLHKAEVNELTRLIQEQNANKIATDAQTQGLYGLTGQIDITTAGFEHASQTFGFFEATGLASLGLVGDEMDAVANTADEFAKTIESAMKQATNPFEHQFPDGVEISEQAMEDFLVGSQLDAAAWVTEIKDLIERGVDSGIVDEIAQAGPKSKPQLDAFVKVVDKQGVEWVNSVSHAGDEATKATEEAFRKQTIAAVRHNTESKLIQEAFGKDLAGNTDANLKAFATSTDENLRIMAYDALIEIGKIRGAIEDIPDDFFIELHLQASLSEDDKALLDWLRAQPPGPVFVTGPGGEQIQIASEGLVIPAKAGGTMVLAGEAGHAEAIVSAGNTMAENLSLMKRAGIPLPGAPSREHGNAPWWTQSGPKMVDNSVHTIVHAEGQPDPTRIGIEMARRQRAELGTRTGG